MKRRTYLLAVSLVIAVGLLFFLADTLLARRGTFIRIDAPNIEPIAACTNSIEFGFGLEDTDGAIEELWKRPDAPASIEVTATVRISDTGEVVATDVFSITRAISAALQVLVDDGTALYPATYYWGRNEVTYSDPDYAGGIPLENGNVSIHFGESVPVGTRLQVVLETNYINPVFDLLLFTPTAYPNETFPVIEEFVAQRCIATTVYLPLTLSNYSMQPTIGLPIDQGFEGGLVPPSGWTRLQTNPRDTWKISQLSAPYSGSYSADCEYDDQLAQQNEVLLSPEFQAASAQLQFYSFGSLYWCRDTYDNCDLKVWLVVGDWGGGDDILVHTADDDWNASWAWSLSSVDLTPYLPSGTPVRVAFQYEGQDGAQIGLDAVSVTQGGALGAGTTVPGPGPNGRSDSQSRMWEDQGSK